LYGTWNPAGGYSVSAYTEHALGSSNDLAQVVNHLGLWVAPDRGILLWTPALVLLAPAVWRNRSDLPDWATWLAVGGLAYTVVQGQLNGFSGGSGLYGYRLTLELLVSLFPAYLLSLPRAGRFAGTLLGPVLGLQFAAISIGAGGEGGMLTDSSSWTDNSFVHALTIAPVAVVWPVLMMLIGWATGYALQNRLGREPPAPGAPEQSGIGADDELDRV
jgi:hypothetical protein